MFYILPMEKESKKRLILHGASPPRVSDEFSGPRFGASALDLDKVRHEVETRDIVLTRWHEGGGVRDEGRPRDIANLGPSDAREERVRFEFIEAREESKPSIRLLDQKPLD